jgi:hypothetical protein
VQRLLASRSEQQQQQQEEEWKCPVCSNAAVIEGHAAAGKVKHQGLLHQILLGIKKFHNKMNKVEDDDDDDLEEEELGKNKEAALHLKNFFGLIESEMHG